MLAITAGGLTRRQALGTLGAGMTAMALAACGGDDDKPSATPASKTGDGKGSAGTLKLWMDSVFAPALTAASAAFTQKYSVKVDVQPVDYGTITPQLQQAGPSGNGPDLVDTNIDLAGVLLDGKLIAPIDLSAKASSFDPRAIKGYTINGGTYALPLVVESINVYRNPTLVPEPVKTWDEFRTVAARLKGKGIQHPLLFEPNAYVFIGMVTAFGGYAFKYNADGTYDIHDVGLDNEGAIEAAAYLAEAGKKGWVKPGVDANVTARVFPQNQAGIQLAGPWQIAAYEKAKAKFEIDPLPAGPAGPAIPWLSARGLAVNAFGKQTALASTFLTEYWAADAPMAAFAKATSKSSAWVPARAQSSSPTVEAFDVAAKEAIPIPSDPSLAAFWTPMADGMTLLMQGKSTAKAVMTNVAKQLRDSVAKR